ncbi:hypothetical protein JTE90_014736 [Oedothorax gibbosus]|uniref:Uncharacterized protein n=1 Tax=Oedothorax gibbosus TaxID=931172 RepID=A0AAV6UQG7_9ARAC|nr:hypothetical protein JTE90_014736 [Oedothorax gibbosus]
MFRRPPSRRTLLIGLLTIDFFIVSIVFLSLSSHNLPPAHISGHPYFLYDLDSNEPKSPPGQKCLLPRVHPFHPSIWQHFTPPKKIVCKSRSENFTYVDKDGLLRFNLSVVKGNGYKVGASLHCFWATVKRSGDNGVEDDKVVYGKEIPLHEDGSLLPTEVEFVQVRCQNFAGVSVYQQLHTHIQTTKKLESQTSVLKNAINVLIFGLDSMSRLSFIRLLPRTYHYLTEKLGMTVFRGMNKVGDNTYPNLVALLTGKKAYGGGLPSTKEDFDDWPLIWKNYSQAGYATMWAEDFPKFGLFNYLAKGFRRPPTDHYLRPFWLAVEESTLNKFSSHMCYGSVPKHMLQMNYVQQFISAYHETRIPYFGFSFLAELSHEYVSRIASADEQFEDFFKFLDHGGHLKNTVLIVMSDHGHRFDAIRSTQVGHIEERMPFYALRVPSSILVAQPHIHSSLSTNTGRLVSPYDMHATLEDLLNFATKNRTLGTSQPPLGCLGQSLFAEVPQNRSCQDASIPPHYCTCESESPILESDSRAICAADATVLHVNELLKNGGADIVTKCSVLTLKSVHSAHLVQSAEEDALKGGERIRVVVEVEPSGAIFEATTLVEDERTQVLVEVSRVNLYGEQSSCIRHVILRKYCYCRDILHLENNRTRTGVS